MHGSFQPLNARLSPAVAAAFPPAGPLSELVDRTFLAPKNVTSNLY
jgi:hypothetical protein